MSEKVKLPMTAGEIEAVSDLQTAKWMLQMQATLMAPRRATFEELLRQIEGLKTDVEEIKQAGKRQANPFSKGPPKMEAKTPGQKPGHAASHRNMPSKVDVKREAELPKCCPECGGQVMAPRRATFEDRVEVQYQFDIPRPIPVVVTQWPLEGPPFNVHVGHCAACQSRVQGRHAEQTSDAPKGPAALGSAGVQIGPNAMAPRRATFGLGMQLKHGMGVSYGKAAGILSSISELTINGPSEGHFRSTLVRADLRVAEKLEPTYHQLILRLRASEVVYADETGWRINGTPAWLWVFTNDEVSVYTMAPRRATFDATRAHEVVEEILGKDFAGVLSCDCFLAYDALSFAQNKCMAHKWPAAGPLLRRCKDIAESKTRNAVVFSRQIAQLLRAAMILKSRQETMSEHGYASACGRIEAALDRLLDKQLSDPDNMRLAKLLRDPGGRGKQRDRLFTFLYVKAVQPTNNLAEREIRPAVIIRKTKSGPSRGHGCNRAKPGARTHSVVTRNTPSRGCVLRTCQKQGHDFIAFVADLLRHPDGLAPPIFKSPLPAAASP